MATRYHILLIIFVVLCVYYPSLQAPLNSVDDPGMYAYLLNTDSFTFKSIFFPGGSGTYFRPLLLSSFLIDKYVWGLEISFMHLDNILIHVINSLLVFCITRSALINKGVNDSYFPLAAGLIFALHPINTESVTWLSGRTDPLAALFLLLSVWSLLKKTSIIGSIISACCLLLACLTKETALFLFPALLVFPFYCRLTSSNKQPILVIVHSARYHFVVMILSVACFFGIRMVAFSKGDQGLTRVLTHVVGGEQSLDILTIFVMMLKAIGFYCKKIVIPFPLNFGIIHVSNNYIFVGLLVLLLTGWVITQRNLPSFFYICSVSVASSALLIILVRITWTPLAERYMYITSAFFVIGVILTVEETTWCRYYKKELFTLATGIILITFYSSFTRNLLWQDNLAFYQDTLLKSPDFYPARNEIAIALKQKGKNKEALEIMQSFNSIKEITNYQYGLMTKAGLMADSGDYTGARKMLTDVLHAPGKLEIAILGKLLEINKIQLLRGKATESELYQDSVIWLTRLYDLSGDTFYQYRLGVLHLHEKNHRKALIAFENVCRNAPKDIYYRKPAEKLFQTLSRESGNR